MPNETKLDQATAINVAIKWIEDHLPPSTCATPDDSWHCERCQGYRVIDILRDAQ